MNANAKPDWQNVERQGVALIDKGILLTGLGDHAGALTSFDKAVLICRPISEKSDPVALILAQALDNKARSLIDLGRSAEAVPCFDEAIQVHEGIVRGEGTVQDVREIATSVMNKGLALMHLDRNDDALACFEQALNGFEECGSDADVALGLANCGDLFLRQDRFDDALEALGKSVAVWEDVAACAPDASKSDYAYALFSRADVLLHLGRYQEALDSSDRSVAIFRTVVSHASRPKAREDLADALKLHGGVLTKLGRIKEADECFREAKELRGKR
jgi:tetratricopeptide (TPR) repeat protein